MLVVVTGGAGFIGSATVELLAGSMDRLGVDKIVVVDDLSSGRHENLSHLLGSQVELVVADVANARSLEEKLAPHLRGYTGDLAFIHLAAVVSIVEARENPVRTLMVNVVGTGNVLELARRYDAERVVYASSVAVYGEPRSLPISEDHPTNPASLYGATKLMGEQLLWSYSREYGLSTIALRYFNVYGPRMRGGAYASVVHNFITALLEDRPPVVYGDGRQTRDFVYVYDVAEANILALQAGYQGPVNIGTGRETSILQLLETLQQITRKRIKPVHKPPRPGDVKRSVADTRRAREVLGWQPKTSLQEGLQKTVEWYLAYYKRRP